MRRQKRAWELFSDTLKDFSRRAGRFVQITKEDIIELVDWSYRNRFCLSRRRKELWLPDSVGKASSCGPPARPVLWGGRVTICRDCCLRGGQTEYPWRSSVLVGFVHWCHVKYCIYQISFKQMYLWYFAIILQKYKSIRIVWVNAVNAVTGYCNSYIMDTLGTNFCHTWNMMLFG